MSNHILSFTFFVICIHPHHWHTIFKNQQQKKNFLRKHPKSSGHSTVKNDKMRLRKNIFQLYESIFA